MCMKLHEFILSIPQLEYVFSDHAKKACIQRNIPTTKLTKILRTQNLVGIELQNTQEQKYKLTYPFTQTKDINIVAKTINSSTLVCITVFPSQKNRRIK